MGMAVAPSWSQTGYRYRTYAGLLAFGGESDATPLADQNTSLTLGTLNYRVGVQISQSNTSLSPSAFVYFYPFFSVNGGSYGPMVRDGNSALASQSAVVTAITTSFNTSSTAGQEDYITGTTDGIRNVNWGTSDLSEVSFTSFSYADPSGPHAFILDTYFKINYAVAQENDVIRVRYYVSTGQHTTVSALQAAITNGDVVPLDAGYPQDATFTVGENVINASPIAVQEPLVLNGDTAFGIQTVPVIAPSVIIGAGAKRLLYLTTGSSFLQSHLDFAAYIEELEGWQVDMHTHGPALSGFDMSEYSVLFLVGTWLEAQFGPSEVDLHIPIITSSISTSQFRLMVGGGTANSTSGTALTRAVSDPRTPSSSYTLTSLSRQVLFDQATNWSSQINGRLMAYYVFTNYAWIAERISSNGYPRVYFYEPQLDTSAAYRTLARNWFTQTHHQTDGVRLVKSAELSWTVDPEV